MPDAKKSRREEYDEEDYARLVSRAKTMKALEKTFGDFSGSDDEDDSDRSNRAVAKGIRDEIASELASKRSVELIQRVEAARKARKYNSKGPTK